MKKICILFSLMMMLMCSGCGPTLEPLIEGTYSSKAFNFHNEDMKGAFSEAKVTIKEITKEEYEEANGINVFIDGYTFQKDEKRYLSIELYLYSVETKQYELLNLIDIEGITGTRYYYYGKANLEIGDIVYEEDYILIAFYYFGDKNRVNIRLFFNTSDEFRSDFKLE
ncbi:MAG: hypothetical protein NC182_03080 [Prevotella sp.]|nr:hypothetical protein [Staphylococcus sp.]MCM1350160.1 hypothetical protein [Prevotella sp.]